MKKKIDKWIAVILMVVMLPWQECYGAYVYGMDMTSEESGETAETEAEDETASGSFEEMTQETNTEETTAAPENVFPETEEGQKTEAVQEPVQDGETDNADTMIELQNEEYHMEPIQIDIVNNLAEVIIREGKGEYQNNTLKLLEDIVIEGGTEFVIDKEGIVIITTIDLNGYSISINGDFYHPEGTLIIDNSSLNVNGNYICEKYFIDEMGQLHEEEGWGHCNLSKNNSNINITNNFIFFSYPSFNGTRLEIGGDFIAKSELYMGMDCIVHGNIILTKKLTIAGNFICQGNLELYDGITNSGTMFVGKTIIAKHGHCYFQTGSTTTVNDFMIENNENPAYVTSHGKMVIRGDLLDYSTAGQSKISIYRMLEIQGNIDVGCIEFNSFDTLLLSGDEQQYITVRDYGKFGTIVNQNTMGYIPIANRKLAVYGQTSFNTAAYIYNGYGYVYHINLTEDTVMDGNIIITEKCAYNFGNYDLTVTGDLIVEAGIYSGGKITVLGNLYLAKLNQSGDSFELSDTSGTWNDMEVYGDLYIKTSFMNRIHEARLHGNLTIEEYIPRITTLVLCGEEKQTLQYNGKRQFEYDVTDLIVTNTSQEVIELTGDPIINGTITANEHQIEGLLVLNGGRIDGGNYNGNIRVVNPGSELKNVTINGDVEVRYNTVLRESVLINGDLKIILPNSSYAQLNNNLTVNGNFETNVPLFVSGNSVIDIKETLNVSRILINDSTLNVGSDVNTANIEIKSGSLNVKGNITAADYMVIQKDTCVSVDGSITTGNYFIIFKEADVTIHGDINAGHTFNIIKQDNFEENEPLRFDGNVTADNIQTVGSSVVIKGSVNCSSQLSISHFNDIHIDGDLTASKISLNLDPSKTTSLYVGGTLDCDMVYNNIGASNVHLEVAGDVIINEGMRLTESSSLIFSGGQFQNVHLGPDCYFETVIVRNTSEEGMYINQTVSCKTFTNETDCKITYGQESGTYGWTLRQDSIIYGDLNLIGGELNLNGYSLTVKGNFCQNGGSIISTKDGTGYRGAVLSIDGNYYYQPQDGAENELTVGIMEIHGNFIQNAGTMFVTGDNYTVRLYSCEEQHLNVPDASFAYWN